jgi:3-isopropylmalate/(R)-2-methylmalate dehydratase small subunit
VTFDGLGEHAFEDDRLQLKAAGKTHPFDDPARAQARVLLVDRNFGCGSSREHAPQALMRWHEGIAAIIGESYAEIFFGNCVALGVPCLTATGADIAKLKQAVATDPQLEVTVDVAGGTATAGSVQIPLTMPEGAKKQLVTGRWDSSAELLEGKDRIAAVAKGIPYFAHWQ